MTQQSDLQERLKLAADQAISPIRPQEISSHLPELLRLFKAVMRGWFCWSAPTK